KRYNEYRQDIPEHWYPQVHVAVKPDSIAWLHSICGSENRSDHRDYVHQRHADDACHVFPTVFESFEDWRPGNMAQLFFFHKCGRFVDLATDDITDRNHNRAEQERHPPTQEVKVSSVK